MQRSWINTVSLDHVQRGMAGGFTQADHGNDTRLRRLGTGDQIAFYSPRTAMSSGEPLQQFTALGTVTGTAPYRVEMDPDFHPWRLDVDFAKVSPVSVRPLLEELSFITDLKRWGFPFRRGLFEIKAPDMEIIRREETRPRGVYTGSIGAMDASGDAAFNVAIRTLTVRPGSDRATLGLGSGIVADSVADDEWRECLQKGRFIPSVAAFDLIETMRIEDGLLRDLPLHLDRLQRSASQFGFLFDRMRIVRSLEERAAAAGSGRLRVTLAHGGELAMQFEPVNDLPVNVRVALVPLPVDRHDVRLRHKTTDRAFYDQAREQSGCTEVIFVDPDGFLTEGSFTNIFVRRDARLVTPPLGRGLLPGILRRKLIESGDAVEGGLVPRDLANGFFIGNSLRGLIAARLDQAVSRRKLAISS